MSNCINAITPVSPGLLSARGSDGNGVLDLPHTLGPARYAAHLILGGHIAM